MMLGMVAVGYKDWTWDWMDGIIWRSGFWDSCVCLFGSAFCWVFGVCFREHD